MRKRGHGGDGSALLATSQGACGDEKASVLASVRTLRPLLAGLVPERLPLCREVSVPGWDTEEQGVILLQLGRIV